ncbi:ABC transporter permease [Candidatus Harpocratesius sp.]
MNKNKLHFKIIVAIAQKNLQILLRDKRTVGLLIGMPILLMVLFGYGFGQPIQHIPVMVLNYDQGQSGIPILGINDTQFSDIAIDFLENDERMDVSLENTSTVSVDSLISEIYGAKKYYALIVFPENFSENLINSTSNMFIDLYIDGSETIVTSSIFSICAEMIGEIAKNQYSNAGKLQLNFTFVAGNEDLRPIDTMAPGILSFALLLFMILTVTGGFTKERLSGTIHRVLISPASKSDLIMGYLLGNSLIALIQSALLLGICVLIFNLSIVGNLVLLFAILFLYAISSVCLGILASAFAENELQAFQFIPLILTPSMFFSGFLFPLISFPKFFQYLSYIIPMTYSIRISKAIMVNGFGILKFWDDLAILSGITIIQLILAIIFFRVKK